jgi:hypothetical protein
MIFIIIISIILIALFWYEQLDTALFITNMYLTYLIYELWVTSFENKLWSHMSDHTIELLMLIGLSALLLALYLANIKVALDIHQKGKNKHST